VTARQLGLRHRTPPLEPHVIVLFGATGDLAKRKLLPGLFHLFTCGLLPARFAVIGSAPAEFALSSEQFRVHAREAVTEFGHVDPAEHWAAFEQCLTFAAADPSQPGPLVKAVSAAQASLGDTARRLFHLAVPPQAFASVVTTLGDSGLAAGAKVIVEKPFGTDLASAQALNATIHAVFDESRIFRIDHFLGKESVDNMLALRFANGLFEPVWNRDHISYVQIDVPETLSIEGRAAFFEPTGTFRDMVVTHLFQVLSFLAMEPPSSLQDKALRSGRTAVLEAMVPLDVAHVVRGQYDGYRQEPGVNPHSDTETLVALRAHVDNWRWAGVPFYLRTGKSMAQSRQVVTLGFRHPVLTMFDFDPKLDRAHQHNELVIDFADPGTITTTFLAKEPGPTLRLGQASMAFSFESFGTALELEGYERLLHDAMVGDQSLFTTADGIERAWEVAAPLLDQPPPVQPYAPGSWGPEAIGPLIRPHRWRLGSDQA
jgi:glucose-6-phosphate 1-dehydrogenase